MGTLGTFCCSPYLGEQELWKATCYLRLKLSWKPEIWNNHKPESVGTLPRFWNLDCTEADKERYQKRYGHPLMFRWQEAWLEQLQVGSWFPYPLWPITAYHLRITAVSANPSLIVAGRSTLETYIDLRSTAKGTGNPGAPEETITSAVLSLQCGI